MPILPTLAERIMSNIADGIDKVPQVGNTVTAVDGLCRAGRCAVNIYCGYSVGGLAGATRARACNRLGKYAITVGESHE